MNSQETKTQNTKLKRSSWKRSTSYTSAPIIEVFLVDDFRQGGRLQKYIDYAIQFNMAEYLGEDETLARYRMLYNDFYPYIDENLHGKLKGSRYRFREWFLMQFETFIGLDKITVRKTLQTPSGEANSYGLCQKLFKKLNLQEEVIRDGDWVKFRHKKIWSDKNLPEYLQVEEELPLLTWDEYRRYKNV